MIDVMDKHFQEELHLSLSQSAWVQFAHWMGYFLMSLPAGWLATRLGYKGGIIAGLLLVAVGGFWFIPATNIAAFWAFLLGVCVVASGLTFLETVANPYTTVLGPPRYAATRINLAQSCNGVGWVLGPMPAGLFFYGKDARAAARAPRRSGFPTRAWRSWCSCWPSSSSSPRCRTSVAEDDRRTNDGTTGATDAPPPRPANRGAIYGLLAGQHHRADGRLRHDSLADPRLAGTRTES